MTEIILSTSKDAATFKTGISGWVDRHGHFFGNDERSARWFGATHVPCCECGEPTPKGYTMCVDCRLTCSIERYNKMDRKTWDGETPLYSDACDKYFFNDDLFDHLEDFDCTAESLRLIICEPMYLTQIGEDYFYDDLPEDDGLSKDIVSALEELNLLIKKNGPVGWMPGKYAATMPEEPNEKIRIYTEKMECD